MFVVCFGTSKDYLFTVSQLVVHVIDLLAMQLSTIWEVVTVDPSHIGRMIVTICYRFCYQVPCQFRYVSRKLSIRR